MMIIMKLKSEKLKSFPMICRSSPFDEHCNQNLPLDFSETQTIFAKEISKIKLFSQKKIIKIRPFLKIRLKVSP